MNRGFVLTIVAAFACLLCGSARAEGPARLVHDFFPDEYEGSQPVSQLTRLGSRLFCVADDLDSGQAVWRTDGTPAGTEQVPIAGSAGARGAQIVGRVGTRMLWLVSPDEDPNLRALVAAAERGDGVVLRTYTIKDLPQIVGGRLYFQDCGTDGTTGCVVWSTDGTPAATRPVSALARFQAKNQRLLSSFADRWLVFQSDGKLLAYDAARNRILTLLPSGAWRVVQVYPAGRTLYTLTRNEQWKIWASRLEAPRGVQVFSGGYVNVMGRRGDSLYFATEDGKLWSTAGRRETTRAYAGLRVDPYSAFADELGTIGSKTFVPNPGYYMGGLFQTDETRREVRELLHVCTGKYSCISSTMSKVTVLGGRLGFEEIDGRLWQSDGSKQGTKRHEVLDRTDASTFRILNGRLLLGGTSYDGEQQLWETDGTAGGTRSLTDAPPDRPFQVETPPVPFAGALFVGADQKPDGKQLWRVEDGHATPVTDLRHLPSGIDPYFAQAVGERYVLTGFKASSVWLGVGGDGTVEEIPGPLEGCSFDEIPCPRQRTVAGESRILFSPYFSHALWSTDGTAAGTYKVLDELLALGPWRGEGLAVDFEGRLWASDGTLPGTRLLTQIPGFVLPVGPPIAAGSLAYLFQRVVEGETASLELWRTDGTAPGTLRLASIPFSSIQDRPDPYPAVVNGRLFFLFSGDLWASDGTLAGTKPLPTQLPIGTFALAAGEDILYAGSKGFGSDGRQGLWAIDPATLEPTLLASGKRIGGSVVGAPLGSLLGNALLFKLLDDDFESWWVSEGTPSSTHPVPVPQVDYFTSPDLVTAGNRRYFVACESEHGCELWSTGRLGDDTHLVQDLWPGPRGSDPVILSATDKSLLFAATDPEVGRELWEIDVSAP